MADFKQNYFQKRTKPRGPRTNQRITSQDVQVIASDGDNLGILNLQDAINRAKEEGLDLIEIAPNAKPPVCKIMDMGKYKYDAQKKANKAKIKNAQKFIAKGDKVKFTIRFKGRELQHSSLGNELMDKIKQDMETVGRVELQPKFDGKQMIMVIQPL